MLRRPAAVRLLHACALPLALVAGACGERGRAPGAGGGDVAHRGGQAVVCTQAAPERLDAFVTPDQLAADLRLIMFTPLVMYDSVGGFRPWLATSWEWASDRRALTLHLRNDVRWHDGQPLTAEDVAWTLRIAADTSYGYWNQSDFAPVAGAVARDPTTVQVTFSQPYVAGLEPLTGLPILPKHLLGNLRGKAFVDADYHRSPVGSGPFRIAGRTSDGAVIFQRNDAFPEALGRPLLDRILLQTTPEPATILTRLRTADVDMCVTGSSIARDVPRDGRFQVIAVEPSGIQGIPLDTRRAPLNDPRVRRALSAALRRADVAAVVSPLAKPARSFFPPASPYMDATSVEPDNDAALASTLLAQAGWSQIGADGIRHDAAGRPLRFTIVAPRPLEAALTVVQEQARKSGIGVDMQFMEWASYLSLVRSPARRPAAMALVSIPDKLVAPDYSDMFGSSGASNLASYRSPAVDSLLGRLRTVVKPDERRDLYRRLQRDVAADVPIVHVVSVPRLAVVGPALKGVRADLNGPFATVNSWWVARR